MDENNQIVNDLKNHMDAMFCFASKVPYREDHLLPVIQACKSLIGLNLQHPPRILLKWMEKYMQEFQPNSQDIESLSDSENPEVLSMIHLKKLIESEQVEESRSYLYNLLQVADHSYIMELILEISFQRSTTAALFCWSAYKSIQFMIPKDSTGILFLSLDYLYKSEKGRNIEKDNAKIFYLYCHSHHIKQKEMIRSEKIVPILLVKMKTIQLASNYNDIIPGQLLTSIQKEGEKGILNYLLSLGINEISPHCILLLDALLFAIRYAPEQDGVLGFKKENIC